MSVICNFSAKQKKKKQKVRKATYEEQLILDTYKTYRIFDQASKFEISFSHLFAPEAVKAMLSKPQNLREADIVMALNKVNLQQQKKAIQKTIQSLKVEGYVPQPKGLGATIRDFLRKIPGGVHIFKTKKDRLALKDKIEFLKKQQEKLDIVAALQTPAPSQSTSDKINFINAINERTKLPPLKPNPLGEKAASAKSAPYYEEMQSRLKLKGLKIPKQKVDYRKQLVMEYFIQKNEADRTTAANAKMLEVRAGFFRIYREFYQSQPYLYNRRISPILPSDTRETLYSQLEDVRNGDAFYKVYFPYNKIKGATVHTDYSEKYGYNAAGKDQGREARPLMSPIYHMIAANRAGYKDGISFYQIFREYFSFPDNMGNLRLQARLNTEAPIYSVFRDFEKRLEAILENLVVVYSQRTREGANERMQHKVKDYQGITQMAYDRRLKTPGTPLELELFFEYLNALSVSKLITAVNEAREHIKFYQLILDAYKKRFGGTVDNKPPFGGQPRGMPNEVYTESKIFGEALNDFKEYQKRYDVRLSHYALNHVAVRLAGEKICAGERDLDLGALHIMLTMPEMGIPPIYGDACELAEDKRFVTPYARRLFNIFTPDERAYLMMNIPHFAYNYRNEKVTDLRLRLFRAHFRALHRSYKEDPRAFDTMFFNMDDDFTFVPYGIVPLDYEEGLDGSTDVLIKMFAGQTSITDHHPEAMSEQFYLAHMVNGEPLHKARHRSAPLGGVSEPCDPYHNVYYETCDSEFRYLFYTAYGLLIEKFYDLLDSETMDVGGDILAVEDLVENLESSKEFENDYIEIDEDVFDTVACSHYNIPYYASTRNEDFDYIVDEYCDFLTEIEEQQICDAVEGEVALDYDYDDGMDDLDLGRNLFSHLTDDEILIGGFFGPRMKNAFNDVPVTALITEEHVATENINVLSFLETIPTFFPVQKLPTTDSSFFGLAAQASKQLGIDIPGLVQFELPTSYAGPILATTTAAALAYFTTRQTLALQTNNFPIPAHLKIEHLNSANALKSGHDTLHSFVGGCLQPKVVEIRPETYLNYHQHGFIKKYEQILPPDNNSNFTVFILLILGVLGVSYFYSQTPPTPTKFDILKTKTDLHYTTREYIHYMKTKRSPELDLILDNGPGYTEYSIKLGYGRIIDFFNLILKTPEQTYTTALKYILTTFSYAEIGILTGYFSAIVLFYILYFKLFTKRYAHELRINENGEVRAAITGQTAYYLPNTFRQIIGFFIKTLGILPQLIHFVLAKIVSKILLFIDYSTKGVYLLVLTITGLFAGGKFYTYLNLPINNTLFEHTTGYYDIDSPKPATIELNQETPTNYISNENCYGQNWTRSPEHADFFANAVKKDIGNAQKQAGFSYLFEPIYGRFGEGENNLVYADGSVRDGRRINRYVEYSHRSFDGGADFDYLIREYEIEDNTIMDGERKKIKRGKKKWKKKKIAAGLEHYEHKKLAKPSGTNRRFYKIFANHTAYSEGNNFGFSVKNITGGRSMTEGPAILGDLIGNIYLFENGALTVIIFAPIIIVYNYLEYIQAFGSKPEALDVSERSGPKKPAPAPSNKRELVTTGTFLGTEGIEIVNNKRTRLYNEKIEELLAKTYETNNHIEGDEKVIAELIKKTQIAGEYANYEVLKALEVRLLTQDDTRTFPKELEELHKSADFNGNNDRQALGKKINEDRMSYFNKTQQIRSFEGANIKHDLLLEASLNNYQGGLTKYLIVLAGLEYRISFAMPYYISAAERFAYLFPNEKDQEIK